MLLRDAGEQTTDRHSAAACHVDVTDRWTQCDMSAVGEAVMEESQSFTAEAERSLARYLRRSVASPVGGGVGGRQAGRARDGGRHEGLGLEGGRAGDYVSDALSGGRRGDTVANGNRNGHLADRGRTNGVARSDDTLDIASDIARGITDVTEDMEREEGLHSLLEILEERLALSRDSYDSGHQPEARTGWTLSEDRVLNWQRSQVNALQHGHYSFEETTAL